MAAPHNAAVQRHDRGVSRRLRQRRQRRARRAQLRGLRYGCFKWGVRFMTCSWLDSEESTQASREHYRGGEHPRTTRAGCCAKPVCVSRNVSSSPFRTAKTLRASTDRGSRCSRRPLSVSVRAALTPGPPALLAVLDGGRLPREPPDTPCSRGAAGRSFSIGYHRRHPKARR